MRNHSRTVLFFHTFALLTAACAGERAEVNDSQSFRVAVLTPGPISDQSWNASAYEGLIRIRDSLGAQISHIQTKTPAEFEENFRQYGALGYDLVFGHGFEFQDAAQRVAPEFPKTIYVTTGGSTTGPNLAAMSFSFDEPSFLAGMAAASVTKSGVVSVIGGTELPPVKSSFVAFSAGAREVIPAITILTAFVGNWDDAGAGKEQALAQMARGADVLFQNADAAGLGVFQAVKETPGTWVVGSNANQNHIAPERTLGSVVIDVPHAFLLVAREVKAGTFEPRVIALDTQSEVVRWVPNPLVSAVPDSMSARIDSVLTLMVAGEFRMPAPAEPSEP
ncbi:MAG TPA: BMP family protein [Gemmatimonadaceae bacterium]|nr:BMP family protein [Gemmatimonadaceae bacterium]